ncbi:hypothetical protein ACFL04_02290 [Patescibacteria group bacterium]
MEDQYRFSKSFSGQAFGRRRKVIMWAVIIVIILGIFWLLLDAPIKNLFKSKLVCPDRTVDENILDADIIVIGSVFAVIPGQTGADVLITPTLLYKGAIPDNGIIIAASPAEGSEEQLMLEVKDDLHFASGQPPYLLFLRARQDDLFNTSKCYGSRALGEGLNEEEEILLGDGTPITSD